jgi:putative transposase
MFKPTKFECCAVVSIEFLIFLLINHLHMNYIEKLVCGKYYHIYNHAVGEECLFREPENYRFFLRKYSDYIHPLCQTYAWCLMPNHFHFLIKVREEECFFEIDPSLSLMDDRGEVISKLVMQNFSNFFNSYAKSYNRKYNRKGALFIDYLRRTEVKSSVYFSRLVYYIHNNPVHHGFCRTMFDWEFSSLHAHISQKETKIERTSARDWFGGDDSFVSYHKDHKVIFSSMEIEALEFF